MFIANEKVRICRSFELQVLTNIIQKTKLKPTNKNCWCQNLLFRHFWRGNCWAL